MNILKQLGFDDNTINAVIEQNGEAILTDLDSNSDLIKDNYILLRNINIECIKELFIYEVDIFLMNNDILKSKLTSMQNINDFVDSVNEDFFNIEVLYE